jgi:hypothetical protein
MLCPEDGNNFQIRQWLEDKESNGRPRCIHVDIRSKGHLYDYEHDRGWYRPTPPTALEHFQIKEAQPWHPAAGAKKRAAGLAVHFVYYALLILLGWGVGGR